MTVDKERLVFLLGGWSCSKALGALVEGAFRFPRIRTGVRLMAPHPDLVDELLVDARRDADPRTSLVGRGGCKPPPLRHSPG